MKEAGFCILIEDEEDENGERGGGPEIIECKEKILKIKAQLTYAAGKPALEHYEFIEGYAASWIDCTDGRHHFHRTDIFLDITFKFGGLRATHILHHLAANSRSLLLPSGLVID